MTTTSCGVNRLVGGLPKVGIRPAIDGRRKGVRESLEGQTMGMAQAVARLISREPPPPLRPARSSASSPTPASAAWPRRPQAAEKFAREGVGVSLTVSPCWCYGSETMDMDPLMPKAVWGFNGTERPGAVYLAAVLAGAQPEGPARLRHLRPRRAGRRRHRHPRRRAREDPPLRPRRPGRGHHARQVVPLAGQRLDGHRRLARSTTTSSSATWACGSRRSTWSSSSAASSEGIYDAAEFERALAWAKTHCHEGKDYNAPGRTSSPPTEKERVWEWSVKMAMIARDLMVGNPRLAELGFGEEALGHNAIAGRLPGPAPVDRPPAQRRLHGSHPQLVVRLERHPPALTSWPPRTTASTASAMLFGHLLTGTAQVFADVRTYWSPAAVKRVTGYELTGRGRRRPDPPDQLRRRRPGRRRPARSSTASPP